MKGRASRLFKGDFVYCSISLSVLVSRQTPSVFCAHVQFVLSIKRESSVLLDQVGINLVEWIG